MVEYGYCVVTKGESEGQIVYYDDDDVDEDGKPAAIVYPGSFLDSYFLIPKSFLRMATKEEVVEAHFQGKSLWPSNHMRIFRRIFVEDLTMAEESHPSETDEKNPPDIRVDVQGSFDRVMASQDDEARTKALYRLAVLTVTWIGLMEKEPSPETLELQKKARKNLVKGKKR